MILDIIVEDKKKRLIEHKNNISEAEMKRLALESERKSISFYDALAKKGLSIIGEFKKASPSHGIMASKVNLEERIRQYNEAVDAISCLTEEDHFNGSTEYLKQIRKMTTLPIIRKDFIIDEYQVYEAKVIGADAILLIAAILEDKKFKELYDLAYSLGLDVLCEVHDEEEFQTRTDCHVRRGGQRHRRRAFAGAWLRLRRRDAPSLQGPGGGLPVRPERRGRPPRGGAAGDGIPFTG